MAAIVFDNYIQKNSIGLCWEPAHVCGSMCYITMSHACTEVSTHNPLYPLRDIIYSKIYHGLQY